LFSSPAAALVVAHRFFTNRPLKYRFLVGDEVTSLKFPVLPVKSETPHVVTDIFNGWKAQPHCDPPKWNFRPTAVPV
jgi:hypothetical protein